MAKESEKALTVFEAGDKERAEAIKNLLRGKTPINEVKKRPGRGGEQWNYVNTYYMTRQIALITGFRWSTEYLEERARPDWNRPVEVGVRVNVYIWDKDGNRYCQASWGSKDVVKYAYDDPKGNYKKGDIISLFDDLKAAESDAIKKALSYFGIASDIYGHKELEFFASDGSKGPVTVTGDEAYKEFGKYLTAKHIPVSKACEILKVSKLSEIGDFKIAHDTLEKEWDTIKHPPKQDEEKVEE